MRGINAEEHQKLNEQPMKLVPLGTEFSESRTVSGLIIPLGAGKEDKLMQINKNVSGLVFGLWRKHLNARVFTIQGEMIFKANEDSYKEIEYNHNDLGER